MKKCRLLVLIALALILVWGGVSCKQEPAFYTVKFEKNADKASGEMNPQLVKSNTETQLNQNLFTRQFYVFAGWSTTEDGKVEYKDKDKVKLSSDVTLYAQWVPDKMTIKFDAVDEKAQGKMDDIVANAKSLVKLTKNAFTLEGYHFDSWYDEDFKEYNDEGEYEFIKDTTLYAWWEPNTYTVKYNVNVEGSKQTMPDQEFEYDDEDFLSENTFTNPGHVFKCWNTEAEGTGTDYLDYQAVENLTAVDKGIVTLYAQWEVDDFAGTEWRMPIPEHEDHIIKIQAKTDGTVKVIVPYYDIEAGKWIDDYVYFEGDYIEDDLYLTLNSTETIPAAEAGVKYVYVSDGDIKYARIDPDGALNPSSDPNFYKRDFAKGVIYYPIDMEEVSTTEFLETDIIRETYMIEESSKTFVNSYAIIHEVIGIETFEFVCKYSQPIVEKGTEEGYWKLKLSGDVTLTATNKIAFEIDDEAKPETCTFYMALPDLDYAYGAYTFTKYTPPTT